MKYFLLSLIFIFTTGDSPYHGWFKNKTEFSFKTSSVTEGKVGGIDIRTETESFYCAQNGMEAVEEKTTSTMNGKKGNPKTVIYITSDKANYAINPEAKTYYKEKGDPGAVMFSKVWMWTRKKSDSYDNIKRSGKFLGKENNGASNTDCFEVSGVKFCFDDQQRLLKYEGEAGGMKTVINFSDYKDKEIDGKIFNIVSSIEAGEYTQAGSMFEI